MSIIDHKVFHINISASKIIKLVQRISDEDACLLIGMERLSTDCYINSARLCFSCSLTDMHNICVKIL